VIQVTATGIITLNTPLTTNSSVEIDGPGADALTIQASGSFRARRRF